MAFSFFAFSPSPLAVKEEETFPKQEKRFPTPSGTRKARTNTANFSPTSNLN